MKDKMKKQGVADPIPTEIQRHKDTLQLIFQQHNLDIEANKVLFETLIDWKRTL